MLYSLCYFGFKLTVYSDIEMVMHTCINKNW